MEKAKESLEEDYDPYLHRTLSHPTNNADTVIHLLKCSIGTGILATPLAFHHAGLISGFVGTYAIGIVCLYCIHILINAQYTICKRKKIPRLSYPHTMRYALEDGPRCLRRFARTFEIVVDVFLIVFGLGICCVYIIFVANSLKKVCDHHWIEINIRAWMTMVLPLFIILNFIRNLKALSPVSTIANISTLVGLALIFYYVFKDFPSPSSVAYVGGPKGFLLFVGTTLFSLEAVGVIIALENNMKTPQNFGGFCGVLNLGVGIVVTLYAFVGFVGYVRYGSEIKSSITLNAPIEEWQASCINVVYAFAITTSYALQCYVPVEIIWKSYLEHKCKRRKVLYENLLRASLVLLTYFAAMASPNLGSVISFVGTLCISALGLIFPALIELCVKYPNNFGRCQFTLWKDCFIMFLGVIAFVAGTTANIHEMAFHDC